MVPRITPSLLIASLPQLSHSQTSNLAQQLRLNKTTLHRYRFENLHKTTHNHKRNKSKYEWQVQCMNQSIFGDLKPYTS